MISRVLFEAKNWRPDAVTLYHTGYYTVPDEMPLELAERAVSEGAAVVVEETKPADKAAKKPKAG